jgi:hypothetical protein
MKKLTFRLAILACVAFVLFFQFSNLNMSYDVRSKELVIGTYGLGAGIASAQIAGHGATTCSWCTVLANVLSKAVSVGDTVDVTITANGEKVAGFGFVLSYDTSMLTASTATTALSGSHLDSPGNSIDTTKGVVQHSASLTGGSTVSGSVSLATISFKAKAPGTATIRLTGSTAAPYVLIDANGNPITGPSVSGVTIEISALPTTCTTKGDFNNNGMVDESDFFKFAAAYGKSPANSCADFNSDGAVNWYDFYYGFADAYTGSSSTTPTPPTPPSQVK